LIDEFLLPLAQISDQKIINEVLKYLVNHINQGNELNSCKINTLSSFISLTKKELLNLDHLVLIFGSFFFF